MMNSQNPQDGVYKNLNEENKIVVTDVERIKLQTGETNNSMTNDQMVE